MPAKNGRLTRESPRVTVKMQGQFEQPQEDILLRFDRLTASQEERGAEKRQKLIDLLTGSPMLFLGAAYRYLQRIDPEKDAGARYLVQVLLEDGQLADTLSQDEVFARVEAQLFAEVVNRISPGLDHLVLERYVHACNQESCLRKLFAALEITASMDSVGRTNPTLVRLLRNGNPKVRSKVVMLLLRNTANVDAAMQWLADEDPRVQSNVLESLWSRAGQRDAQQVFRLYVSSKVARVATNALVGLHLGGDPEALARLVRNLRYGNATFQRSAAWAMGYLKDPAFQASLEDAVRNASPAIRGLALRALVAIRKERRDHADEDDGAEPELMSELLAIRAGAKEWNAWRAAQSEMQPSLEGMSLARHQLVGADLSYCCLRNADLSRSNLSLCNLFGADLRGANLSGATIHRADMRCCEMNGKTKLDKASLVGTSLVGSELGSVSAHGVQLQETEGADMLTA